MKPYTTPSIEGQRRYSPPRCHRAGRSPVVGEPEPDLISTSFVEWQNLNLRMGVRRFTRLMNAFSKKLDDHVHSVAPCLVWYSFCRGPGTLRTSPSQAVGLVDELYDASWLIGMVDDLTRAPKKPGPKGPWKHKSN